MKIPRIIHQTWTSRDIPHHIYRREWVESWSLLHPGWEYKLWTDEDLRALIERHYPDFLEVFDAYPANIQRADTGRYFILRHYGGVYADLDYMCLKNLEPLLEDYSLVLTRVNENISDTDNLSNALMISEKDCMFWDFVVDELNRSKGIVYVEESTGPAMLYRAFRKFLISKRFAEADFKIKVYDHEVLSPIDWRESSIHKGTLSRETINDPARYFPDAYAVTFWTHVWESGERKSFFSKVKGFFKNGKVRSLISKLHRYIFGIRIVVASLPNSHSTVVWQSIAGLPQYPKVDIDLCLYGSVKRLHKFTAKYSGRKCKCIFIFGDVVHSVISTYENQMNEQHFQSCGYFGPERNIFKEDFLNYERIFDEWIGNNVYPTVCVRYEKLDDYLPQIEDFLGIKLQLPENKGRSTDFLAYDPSVIREIEETYSSLIKKVNKQKDFSILLPEGQV